MEIDLHYYKVWKNTCWKVAFLVKFIIKKKKKLKVI